MKSVPQSQCPRVAGASFAKKFNAALLLWLLGVVASGMIPGARAQTATVKLLHQFSTSTADGLNPTSKLIQGKDGNFYGTTAYSNQSYGPGAVYKITPAGVVTILYNFSDQDSHGINSDGTFPANGLIQGTDGNFYGTAEDGGYNGYGTVFKLTPAGVLTVLHQFSAEDGNGLNTEGANPRGLIQGSDGNFYGTAEEGGKGGTGTLFKITAAGTLTVLHSFTAESVSGFNADGAYPYAQLTQGKDGNFYGTASDGGKMGLGTIYKLTPAGVFTTLYSFTNGDSDGYDPVAPLVQGTDGNFYGTAQEGGMGYYGTVFKITPAGVFTGLHAFDYSDGAFPIAGLIQNTDGLFYGTTENGGTHGTGTVFKITAAGVLTTLHNFSGYSFNFTTYDGIDPDFGLVRGTDGYLYGAAAEGGASGYGTVYKINSAGTFGTLHSFGYPNNDGAQSAAALVQGKDGSFYGTATSGGTGAAGALFKITAAGVFTTLHSFHFLDGAAPSAPLIQGTDGNFYGTTASGSTFGNGTVFKMTAAGAVTTLHNFSALEDDGSNVDGAIPTAALVQGTDGNFYGAAQDGGKYGYGVVFKMTPAGVLTVLHSFSALSETQTNSDGAYPSSTLIHAKDGNFYGTTEDGGAGGYGVTYKITAAGVLTTLHNFSKEDTTGINSDGGSPSAALLQGADGNFYGTTSGGGLRSYGTAFKMTAAGAITTLHIFTAETAYDTNPDGALPEASFIQAKDGNFYSVAYEGGTSGAGTAFKVTSAGVFTNVYNYESNTGDVESGGSPNGLIQGTNGYFYGTTYHGGTGEAGTIIQLYIPAATPAAAKEPPDAILPDHVHQ